MIQPVTFAGASAPLVASAARTANGTGSTLSDLAGRMRYAVLLSIADASTTDAGDTLDVYVDLSPDGGTTWLNAIHFTQRAGDASGAASEIAILDPSNPGTSVIDATSDAASGVARPAVFGNAMRARWVIVDSGDANSSHTFGITVFAI